MTMSAARAMAGNSAPIAAADKMPAMRTNLWRGFHASFIDFLPQCLGIRAFPRLTRGDGTRFARCGSHEPCRHTRLAKLQLRETSAPLHGRRAPRDVAIL